MWKKPYSNWVNRWENQLCFRSTDRIERPFDWGLDYTASWPRIVTANGHSPESDLADLNRHIIENSDDFFGYAPPRDFELKGDILSFTTPCPTPHGPNNTVRVRVFPGRNPKGRAVVVLPHWNSHAAQHVGLCKGIAAFGPTAIRLSLPYHDERMPPELTRADYAVSSNICRTIEATRQAVVDTRACFDWLEQQGYDRLGVVGTSLGSCYAFLASAHDPRIKVNVFNHCSSHFSDVVWTGLSTIHIKKTLAEHLDMERLRSLWQCISPVNYMAKYATHTGKKQKFIYTEYDTTFLPYLSEEILACVRDHGIPHEVAKLPCGHYTMGETPFKFMDGYQIISSLVRWL